MVLTREGAYLEGVVLSVADRRLFQNGDHINQNDGCHLDGGITDDDVQQMRWQPLFSKLGSRYRSPQDAVGRRFVKYLTEEFRGVRERLWNADHPMVFMEVIL